MAATAHGKTVHYVAEKKIAGGSKVQIPRLSSIVSL
jgi:hypothetical protein